MPVTKDQVLDALKKVMDPELHRDVVTLNMVTNLVVEGDKAEIQLTIPKSAARIQDQLEMDIKKALSDATELTSAKISFEYRLSAAEKQAEEEKGKVAAQKQAAKAAQQSPQDVARESNPLPHVKNIIAVGAGKGGVGKSTVSVNMAVALARTGAKVGIMDGDIYGPSLPTMMGTDQLELKTIGNMIIPFEVHGVKATTIGALVEDDKPLIWRGPMAHGAFKQLATQTEWGDLDYLIVDLPPGTGDVPLTLSQLLPLTGAVVVCTPQKVAQDDAVRALKMFQQLDINILGVVENMSYFIGDDGKEYDIFGKGGAEKMAQKNGVPFLGSIPINMKLRENSDSGNASANFEDEQLAKELLNVANNLKTQTTVAGNENWTPSISIS